MAGIGNPLVPFPCLPANYAPIFYQTNLLTMKHVRSVAIAGNCLSIPERVWKIFLLLFAFLVISSSFLKAQNLICNGASSSSPLQVAIDNQCSVFLTPDAILEAPQNVPGDKRIVVRDELNNVLADGVNEVLFDGSAQILNTLSVTILEVSENTNFCVGYITLVDNVAPIFSNCELVRVQCSADTTAAVIGIPSVSDNCTNNPLLSYEDDVVLYSCDSLDAGIINREWTAIDDLSNVQTCTQQIVLERPNLNAIVFPADTTLSCNNPNASPDSIGRPILDDIILRNGGFCNLRVGFTDDTTALCGETEFQIIRTWQVTESCSNTSMAETQIILILDSQAPEITCQDDIVIPAVAGQCFATVSLPIPEIMDNCDSQPDLLVSTSYGSTGLGPHPFVPVGSHTAQFVAIDECGNMNSCTIKVTVVDSEVPTAVCGETSIGISSGGIAIVNAEVFDEGSLDNCAQTLYYKARKVETGSCNDANGDDSNARRMQEWFDDRVVFCCEEVDTEVMVRLKVYEIDPGPGPVDPTREEEGGDLFRRVSECMISVDVQDKIGPSISCPEDVQIDCSEDIGDLSRFGSPIITDNCGFTLDSMVVEELNECGLGRIKRIFTASDALGNSNSCTQIINIVEGDPYVEGRYRVAPKLYHSRMWSEPGGRQFTGWLQFP